MNELELMIQQVEQNQGLREGFKLEILQYLKDQNVMSKEDLVEPLAEGIQQYYREKRNKNIININELKDIQRRVHRISIATKDKIKEIQANKKNFEYGKDFFYSYINEKNESFKRGIVITPEEDLKQVSEDLDKVMKELKILGSYIANNSNVKELEDIGFTLIASSSDGEKIDEHTILFDAPIDASMRGLTEKGISIKMEQVPALAKKLWTELGKEEKARECNQYLNVHLYNYRKMLIDTKRGKKTENSMPKAWKAYAGEAFIEHMTMHESHYFTMFQKMLSGKFKYNNESTMLNEASELARHYGNFKPGDRWKDTSGESAALGWAHYVGAQGNLNGLTFGDVGRQQVKATVAKFINEASWENIERAIQMLIDIQRNKNAGVNAIETAKQILNSKEYKGYFVENAINRSEKSMASYLSKDMAEFLSNIAKNIKPISRGG